MNRRQTSRRDFIKTTALALPLIAAGCSGLQTKSAASGKSARDFVSVRNGRFELGGKPHYFVGTNMWYGCYLSDAKLSGGRARLIRELDRLQAIGVTNIRLLAGSETSPLGGAISRGITRSPARSRRGFARGPGFLPRRNVEAQYARNSFCFKLLAMVGRLRAIRPLGDRPDDSRPGSSPQFGHGDWSGFMKFSAASTPRPPPTSFISITSPASSSAATRSMAAFTATTRPS
jgi:hypothetical protein